MARVIVKESVCLGKKFFDGTMVFKDVEDMVKKVGKVDGAVNVFKATRTNKFTNNIHNVLFYKDGVSYEIHLTERQFKLMNETFAQMGEIDVTEYFWWHHRHY